MNEDLIKISIEGDSKSLVSSVKEAGEALDLLGKGYTKLNGRLDKINDKAKKVGKAITGAGLGIELFMAANVKTAADFEAAMNNVYTIVDRNNKATDGWEQSLLAMSRSFPVTATSLAEGLYEINSSGISATDSMSVLRDSAQAASAGLTDTDTASRAITASLNAYGLAADQSTYVSDVLFTTVDKGVISFEELAQNIGDWVSSAAAAGVPLNEASAALATMTLSGINAAEASTALKSVMQAFIKPSEDMETAVSELGYATPLAMVGTIGLKSSIEDLLAEAGGAPAAMAGMFNNIRAFNGVLALTNNEGESYNRVFAEMDDRTEVVGASQRAYAEQSKSFSQVMAKLKNSFTAFRIEMGTYLLPILGDAAGKLQIFIDIYGRLPGFMKEGIALLTVLSGAIMIVGGLFMVAAAKATLFSIAIKGTNKYLGTSIPEFTSLAKAIWAGALRFGQAIPILGKYISRMAVAGATANKLTKAVALGAASVLIGLNAWSGYSDGIEDANQKIVDLAKNERSTWGGPLDIEGRTASLDKMGADLDSVTKKIDEQISGLNLVETAWKNGFSWATGGGSPIRELGEEEKELNYQIALQADELANINNNVLHYADRLGLTKDEVTALALATETDLSFAIRDLGSDMSKAELGAVGFGSSLDPVEIALKAAAEAMEDGSWSAMGLGGQLKQTTGIMKYAEDGTLELTKSQEALQSAIQGMGDASGAWDDALDEKIKGMEKYGEAAVAFGTMTEEELTDKTDAARLSLEEYAQTLLEQNYKLLTWESNLLIVAERTSTGVAGYLASMGESGVDLVAEMANGTEEEVTRMATEIERNMKLTAEGTSVWLESGFAVAQETARQGASATVASVATELNMLPAQVEEISRKYGLALTSGLTPVMSVLGLDINDALGLGGLMSANSGTYGRSSVNSPRESDRGYADGGFNAPDGHLPSEATYQRGPRIQWAEPETDGEWFIPKAKSKRGRSEAILEDAASEFGFGLVKFASGGFLSGLVPSIPSVDSVKAKGEWGSHALREFRGAFDIANKVSEVGREKQAEIDRLRSMTVGSSTGLNPEFFEQYNRYNRALGNKFTIISAWRSTAKQAVLYAKYLAGTGNLAARPGTSNHERGLAIDHSPRSTQSDRAIARQFRIHYPVGSEMWHAEPFADGGFLSGFKAAQSVGMPTGVFDNGGTLKEGWNATYNGTGSPEKLIRANMGSEGGGTITYAPVFDILVEGGQSPDEFRKVLEQEVVPALERQYQKFAAMSNRKERSR